MLTRTNSEIKCEKTDREGITILEFTGTVCVGMLKKLQVFGASPFYLGKI